MLEHRLHPTPGYPFTLDLRVEYSLAEDGLTVRVEATNVGEDACPYGFGAHPYLAGGDGLVDGLELRVPAETALISDERSIPIGRQSVDGTELDFRTPKPIGSVQLDHCFTDLQRDGDGRARVELGGRAALWVDESYPYVMVFTGDALPDVARRSLAVEPMTCAPNAFRSGDGLIRLEPGRVALGQLGNRSRPGLTSELSGKVSGDDGARHRSRDPRRSDPSRGGSRTTPASGTSLLVGALAGAYYGAAQIGYDAEVHRRGRGDRLAAGRRRDRIPLSGRPEPVARGRPGRPAREPVQHAPDRLCHRADDREHARGASSPRTCCAGSCGTAARWRAWPECAGCSSRSSPAPRSARRSGRSRYAWATCLSTSDLPHVWHTWWLGDTAGALVVVPLRPRLVAAARPVLDAERESPKER